MAAFSEDTKTDFLFGVWVTCSSSNVQEAHYDAEAQLLTLGFGKAGAGAYVYYHYYDVPVAKAERFAEAPSKGAWVDRELKKTKWPFGKAFRVAE